MFCRQNHVVEVPAPGNKKWVKNKKKAGKKAKKKGGAAAKGAPVKKTSTANSMPSTAASTSSLASTATDVTERKDSRAGSQHTSPTDLVITCYDLKLKPVFHI